MAKTQTRLVRTTSRAVAPLAKQNVEQIASHEREAERLELRIAELRAKDAEIIARRVAQQRLRDWIGVRETLNEQNALNADEQIARLKQLRAHAITEANRLRAATKAA